MAHTNPIRWARVSAAVLTIFAGIAMLVLPGPGIVTVAGGLAALGREVPRVARALAAARRWAEARWALVATRLPARWVEWSHAALSRMYGTQAAATR